MNCLGTFAKNQMHTNVRASVLSFLLHLLIWLSLYYCPEKAVAPHFSTLAWKIPWTEEPGRLQSMGHWGLDTTERLHFHFSLSCIGEGNGNPLQCSCLENPRDGGAWRAAVYGVAQSRTRLKRLSSRSNTAFYCIRKRYNDFEIYRTLVPYL